MIDSIPDNEVQMAETPSAAANAPADQIPDSAVELDSDKYGGVGQQAIAGLEGVAQGIAGPIATAVETGFGVPKEDILGRARENPVTAGVGQAAGLVGSSLTGVGEGAMLSKIGQGAGELVGLGKATSIGAKIGSSAVQQAAEMAALQSGDEVSKQILQDPEASTQTAIANVGMAAALGGIGGAALGTVNPIWKATVGPKVDEFLGAFKSHLNGLDALETPDAVKNAQAELGIPIEPAMNSALSGNPTAVKHFNILREVEHPEIMRQINDLTEKSQKAVVDSLGIPLEDIAHSSDKEAGDRLKDVFTDEYNKIHEPVAARQEAKAELDKTVRIPDEENLDQYGKLLTAGMKEVGTDSPYYKLYNEYGNRMLARNTVGEQAKLRSEILAKARTLGMDPNEKTALNSIAASMDDFHNSVIERQSRQLEKDGAEYGKAIGNDVVNERNATKQEYKDFAQMSQQLTDHLNIKDFRGAGGLKKAIAEVTPETLVRKFSPKGDVGSIEFLQRYFPETLKEVQANEAKRLLRSSVYSDAGATKLNLKTLSRTLDNTAKTAPELLKFALPGKTVEKVAAAKVLQDALPEYRSSKTAHWLTKLLSTVPQSVMAMVGALSTHGALGGIGGYAVGELMQRLGRDVPDAARLSLLNFLSADKPVNSEALKASVDFMHEIYQGNKLLNKSMDNVFKAGASVIPDSKLPSAASRAKIDRLISDREDHPNEQIQAASQSKLGHYLPNHEAAMAETSTRALQYLQQLKPKPTQTSLLDRPIEPTAAQQARYNRALDIAHSPAIVMDKIKDGSLQASDIQDMVAMYPALYKQMVQQLTNKMGSYRADEEQIPYRVRMGLSLFLGQPLDSSMQPQNIMAAQPKPKPMSPQMNAPKSGKSANSLSKMSKSYSTPNQAAESDRSNRD